MVVSKSSVARQLRQARALSQHSLSTVSYTHLDVYKRQVDLQRRILDAVWSYLPSGGHLAYITCTMNPAENEGQIDAFLARTPGASLEKQWQSTPDAFGSDLMYGAMLKKA